jgi:hypothetical protein
MMALGAPSNKLVIYIEEKYEDVKDMSCYVLYDETEKEYFVCGSRRDEAMVNYAQFHFYCKSRDTLVNYIAFIVNASGSCISLITYGLYSYDIFGSDDEHEMSQFVSYSRLDKYRSDTNELALYVDMTFSSAKIHDLLNIIREVRY